MFRAPTPAVPAVALLAAADGDAAQRHSVCTTVRQAFREPRHGRAKELHLATGLTRSIPPPASDNARRIQKPDGPASPGSALGHAHRPAHSTEAGDCADIAGRIPACGPEADGSGRSAPGLAISARSGRRGPGNPAAPCPNLAPVPGLPADKARRRVLPTPARRRDATVRNLVRHTLGHDMQGSGDPARLSAPAGEHGMSQPARVFPTGSRQPARRSSVPSAQSPSVRAPLPTSPRHRGAAALAFRPGILAAAALLAVSATAVRAQGPTEPAWARCPIPELRASYRETLSIAEDPAALMAVEQEILELCARRAEAVARLLSANAEVAEARAEARARRAEADRSATASPATPSSAPPPSSPAPADTAPTTPTVLAEAAPAPSRALAAFLPGSLRAKAALAVQSPPEPAHDGPRPSLAPAHACPEPSLPRPIYAIGSIWGRSGDLRAVLWQDGQAWTVSAGSELPGGARVDSVSVDGVRVRGETLPWR